MSTWNPGYSVPQPNPDGSEDQSGSSGSVDAESVAAAGAVMQGGPLTTHLDTGGYVLGHAGGSASATMALESSGDPSAGFGVADGAASGTVIATLDEIQAAIDGDTILTIAAGGVSVLDPDTDVLQPVLNAGALGADTLLPLTLSYQDGFSGQRLVLGGGVVGVMPYVQVVPTTREGTDAAGSIAGYQLYMTTGGALSADREFLAIEARGENASASYAPYFQINTWASGTGSYLPLRIGTGTVAHLLFGPNTTDIRVLEGSRFLWDADTTTYGACPATPILATRSNQVAVQLRTVTTTAATGAAIQLGRGRGTTTSITAPNVADALGKVHFGDVTGGTYTERSGVQGVAASHANDWNQGTGVGRGAGVEIYGTVPGATAFGRTAIFMPTTTNDETAMTIACRLGGSTSLKLVTLGAADSGGTGYRMLRVAN